MHTKTRTGLGALAIVALLSCLGADHATAGECPAPVSGRWTGTWDSTEFPIDGTFVAKLYFNDGQVSGTFTLQGSPVVVGGRVAGSVTCDQLTLHTTQGVAMEIDGTLGGDGQSVSGNYTLPELDDSGTIDAQMVFAFENQPDGTIRETTTVGRVGNDIYNTTGEDQTAVATRSPQEIATFNVRFQNDGNVKDNVVVHGPGDSPHFRVRYFLGQTDVTAAVVAGNLRLRDIPPGGLGASLRVVVKVRVQAAPDETFPVLVVGSSAHRPSQSDAVLATVTVPAG